MSPSVTLRVVGRRHRHVIERLWQLHRHDLSEFRGSMPNDDGLYKAGWMPSYFGDRDRRGYLIHRGPDLAGFALIRGLSRRPMVLGEFFIVRAARRQRVGYTAATALLREYPGPWEIAFQEENPGAARFWRLFARDIAGNTVVEELRPVPNKPQITPDVWLKLTV